MFLCWPTAFLAVIETDLSYLCRAVELSLLVGSSSTSGEQAPEILLHETRKLLHMDRSFSNPLRFAPVDLTHCNYCLPMMSRLGPSGAQS